MNQSYLQLRILKKIVPPTGIDNLQVVRLSKKAKRLAAGLNSPSQVNQPSPPPKGINQPLEVYLTYQLEYKAQQLLGGELPLPPDRILKLPLA